MAAPDEHPSPGEDPPDPGTDGLLAAAAEHRQRHHRLDSALPRLRVAIVACMDARLDLYTTFGLRPGDVHLIRNAGGVVTEDVLRSLTISQRKLGTREVLLVHHTGCGMQTFGDDELRAELLAETGMTPSWSPETFRDLDQEVRQSMLRVRRCPFLLHPDAVRGFVLDVEDGSLREVAG